MALTAVGATAHYPPQRWQSQPRPRGALVKSHALRDRVVGEATRSEMEVARLSARVETEPALRTEELGLDAVADMIARIEELRRLLREQREVLLDLLAESAGAGDAAP